MPVAPSSKAKPIVKKVVNTIPKTKQNIVLDDLDKFVKVCKNAVNARMDTLTDTDDAARKVISNKILINCFRGCKWTP